MEIKIDYKPKIFDSKKYCENEETRCNFLHYQYSCCRLFNDKVQDDFQHLEKTKMKLNHKKCDQCKEEYKKAKSSNC